MEKENDIDGIEKLENQIDIIVYHLYCLTYDEVLVVDVDIPISREEYEAHIIESSFRKAFQLSQPRKIGCISSSVLLRSSSV